MTPGLGGALREAETSCLRRFWSPTAVRSRCASYGPVRSSRYRLSPSTPTPTPRHSTPATPTRPSTSARHRGEELPEHRGLDRSRKGNGGGGDAPRVRLSGGERAFRGGLPGRRYH